MSKTTYVVTRDPESGMSLNKANSVSRKQARDFPFLHRTCPVDTALAARFLEASRVFDEVSKELNQVFEANDPDKTKAVK